MLPLGHHSIRAHSCFVSLVKKPPPGKGMCQSSCSELRTLSPVAASHAFLIRLGAYVDPWAGHGLCSRALTWASSVLVPPQYPIRALSSEHERSLKQRFYAVESSIHAFRTGADIPLIADAALAEEPVRVHNLSLSTSGSARVRGRGSRGRGGSSLDVVVETLDDVARGGVFEVGGFLTEDLVF